MLDEKGMPHREFTWYIIVLALLINNLSEKIENALNSTRETEITLKDELKIQHRSDE